MKKKHNRGIQIILALIVCMIAFVSVYVVMPKHHFKYNLDATLSPYGMAMSKTFLNMPMNAPADFQGYIRNGEFNYYTNWPSLSFRTLALWFWLLGDDSIYTARLFSAFIYSLNALLFYLLLIRSNVSEITSFLSTLIFIFLPTHLDFSYLIYADIWCITFWLLGLIVLGSKLRIRFWLFILITLIGTFFYWFVFFVLPAFFVFQYLKTNTFQTRPLVLGAVAFTLAVWIIQIVVVSNYSHVYITQAIQKYSVFGFFIDIEWYAERLLKRIASVGYEAFFLVPLWMFSKYIQTTEVGGFESSFQKLKQIVVLLLIAIALFLIVFPNWFAIHRHVLALISIPIGVVTAFAFLFFEKQSTKVLCRGALIAGGVCLIMFNGLPFITHTKYDISRQDEQIASFINKKRFGENQKICLFFDLPNKVHNQYLTNEFSIREYTNAYTFTLEDIRQQESLEETFRYGLNKLENIQVHDFDEASVFLITTSGYKLNELNVQDSLIVNGLKVYYIKLAKSRANLTFNL